MFKVLFMLAVLLTVTVRANPSRLLKRPTTTQEIILLEEPCVRQGGICMLTEDCPPYNLVQVRAVLCPQQRHLGVECCYV